MRVTDTWCSSGSAKRDGCHRQSRDSRSRSGSGAVVAAASIRACSCYPWTRWTRGTWSGDLCLARSSLVDSAVYVGGRRVQFSGVAGRDLRRSLRPRGRGGLDRAVPAGRAASSRRWPRSSSCTSSPSRTRSWPTSARSSSATATRCSSCCAPPATSTTSRRSSSASCTCSSAATSSITVRHSEAPDLAAVRHRLESRSRRCSRRGPEAVLYAILDSGRRRLRAGGRRSRERHRRDRDRGVPRRPGGVAAHLRALPRGHRVPARDPAR